MKKILLFVISSLILISCNDGNNSSNNICAVHFEYNGHKYIQFGKYARERSVVHDPDCECIRKN